ncbi:Uncharacterized protein C57A7.06 [Olea europaea subsp. europaea]|uniref:Uncharacterized protein C57A7.06 n=1 Tax=Olea europaea subsp. europaea TaxID=158383 RepID=A0A8S0TXH4_OLEEU|nr:Uncharacterized protein C57A7.06 [Olea europaea subsp. europaea]
MMVRMMKMRMIRKRTIMRKTREGTHGCCKISLDCLGKKRKKELIISEPYPESEYYPSCNIPKPDQERLERKAAYEQSKNDITKWEPSVKRNREAPTLYFDEDVDLGFSGVGAIASEFEPRIDFEKKIASLVNDTEVVEAYRKMMPGFLN